MIAADVLARGADRDIEKDVDPDAIAAMIEEVATAPAPRGSLIGRGRFCTRELVSGKQGRSGCARPSCCDAAESRAARDRGKGVGWLH